ncbi:MAG: hypothetical protein PHH82_03920 [Candidatus ainarchaeum sp.]|nr:hypothetical protein [Candidatus ainarchaeum sp.]
MKYLGLLLVVLLCFALLFSGCVGSSTTGEEKIAGGEVKAGETYSASDSLSDWKNIVDAIDDGKTVKCEYNINGNKVTMILSEFKNYMHFYGLTGATSPLNAQTEFKDNTMTSYVWQDTGSVIPDEYLSIYKQYVDIPDGKRIGAKNATPSTAESWKSTWDYDPDKAYSSEESQFDMSWSCSTLSYAFGLPTDVYFIDQQEVAKQMGGE